MEAIAPSATSTPASAAFRIEAALMPLVSCVWKWIGNADLLAQRLHQLVGGVGLAQPGHVLDGQDVRAHALQFLGHAHVVVERILVALRIEDVAGVADRRFADRCRSCAPLPSATFMLGSQFSESKMRKMSMPCAAASR